MSIPAEYNFEVYAKETFEDVAFTYVDANGDPQSVAGLTARAEFYNAATGELSLTLDTDDDTLLNEGVDGFVPAVTVSIPDAPGPHTFQLWVAGPSTATHPRTFGVMTVKPCRMAQLPVPP